MNGILLVDKPPKVTSHDVVDHIRRVSGMRRVGHTGTLDPAATGLLVLCLGHATRLSEFLTGLDKVYEGVMRLGIVTDSHDLDGAVLDERPVPDISLETVQQVFDQFTGEIQQIPPMVSAVKVGGERLYSKARKGETVERQARAVTVYEFRALSLTPPDVAFRVRCTRGTYARSLVHDAGQQVGCGAALAELRRTRVGAYSVEEALAAGQFRSLEDVVSRLIPMDDALNLPAVIVTEQGHKTILSGGALGPADLATEFPSSEGWVQVKSRSGKLLALAMVSEGLSALVVQPKRVFCA